VLNYPATRRRNGGPCLLRTHRRSLRHHGIYVLSDLAYCEIYFDGNPPPSILQVKEREGHRHRIYHDEQDVFHGGLAHRLCGGNKRLINALTRIKSYLDYGAFTPIQVAATAAINGPQDCVEEIRNLYKKRRDVLVKGLKGAGWDVPSPKASMFAWAPLPEAYREMGSLAFSKLLLKHAEVAVAPA